MNKNTKALLESTILVALGVILSMIKIIDLPYGGSVTIASMLPVVIIAYRHGLGYGFASGLAYAIVQQLLGLNTLSYVTTWQSILAVVLLDYIIAFLVCGLGGVFRRTIKHQATSLMLGSMLVCVLRYVCHVISGATVWAGISIPTSAALIYSFIYNATYMLPETIISVLVAYYIGSTIDLSAERPTRIKKNAAESGYGALLGAGAGLAVICGLIVDTVLVFSKLQDAETGEFNFAQIAQVNLSALITVSVICAVVAAILFVLRANAKKPSPNQN